MVRRRSTVRVRKGARTERHIYRNDPLMSIELPLPPLEMMQLVGSENADDFDNTYFSESVSSVAATAPASIFDFGCGCGRTIRALLKRGFVPPRYVGVDLHSGMIDWCNANVAGLLPGSEFTHLDVYHAGFNPSGATAQVAFPTTDQFETVLAFSVFTHIVETDLDFYFDECMRVLQPGGRLVSSWFIFDEKDSFPMMQSFQNALYINPNDATNAVLYHRDRVLDLYRSSGLKIIDVTKPKIRGFQWQVIASADPEADEVELGIDDAPPGLRRPPILDVAASDVRAG